METVPPLLDELFPPASRALPPPVRKAKGAAGFPSAAPPPLSGSYAWRGGRLVVIVEVESGELEWAVPIEAFLLDAQGRVITCVVDATRTTAAGTIEAGRSFRIALEWEGPEGASLATLLVTTGTMTLAIPLSEG